MIYLQLFYNFFMTGLFSIGGGLATLPFLYDMADRTGWFTAAELADMLAVSESTPGAIGINMATYIGFKAAGLPGDIIATLGLITPGIIVILIIARVLDKFRQNKFVDWTFYGLRAASVGLIAAAGISVVEISLLHLDLIKSAGVGVFDIFDIKGIILALLLFAAMKKWESLHPVVFIAISAIIGVIFSFAGV